jgi:hypothetical protein
VSKPFSRPPSHPHPVLSHDSKLTDVLEYDLRTVRACLLKESFDGFEHALNLARK